MHVALEPIALCEVEQLVQAWDRFVDRRSSGGTKRLLAQSNKK